jgi:hypothetical protein
LYGKKGDNYVEIGSFTLKNGGKSPDLVGMILEAYKGRVNELAVTEFILIEDFRHSPPDFANRAHSEYTRITGINGIELVPSGFESYTLNASGQLVRQFYGASVDYAAYATDKYYPGYTFMLNDLTQNETTIVFTNHESHFDKKILLEKKIEGMADAPFGFALYHIKNGTYTKITDFTLTAAQSAAKAIDITQKLADHKPAEEDWFIGEAFALIETSYKYAAGLYDPYKQFTDVTWSTPQLNSVVDYYYSLGGLNSVVNRSGRDIADPAGLYSGVEFVIDFALSKDMTIYFTNKRAEQASPVISLSKTFFYNTDSEDLKDASKADKPFVFYLYGVESGSYTPLGTVELSGVNGGTETDNKKIFELINAPASPYHNNYFNKTFVLIEDYANTNSASRAWLSETRSTRASVKGVDTGAAESVGFYSLPAVSQWLGSDWSDGHPHRGVGFTITPAARGKEILLSFTNVTKTYKPVIGGVKHYNYNHGSYPVYPLANDFIYSRSTLLTTA